MADVVKITIYVTDIRDQEVWRARQSFSPHDFPASTRAGGSWPSPR
ncbi:MAG: RidA family protein [Alphaproteobacteria bacterium]